MYNWLGNQVGFNVANFIFLIIGLLLVLIAIIIVIAIIRRLTSGTYIEGGKDRQPRLSVQDALPVDKMRQIVLIKRDGIEHLIMIGGPNDLVIETNIKKNDIQGSSQKIEPEIQIEDFTSNEMHQFVNQQKVKPQHREPAPAPKMQPENTQNLNVPQGQNSETFQRIPNEVVSNTEVPSPTRLHPTYPLKQVSAGIYSGRTSRPIENNESDIDTISTMRIENPYRKEPQQQNLSQPNEHQDKIEPQFTNIQPKQTIEFPENIMKDIDK